MKTKKQVTLKCPELRKAYRILTEAEDYKVSVKISTNLAKLKKLITSNAGLKKLQERPETLLEAERDVFRIAFHRINKTIMTDLVNMDNRNLVLNTAVRVILEKYLRTFARLCKRPPTQKNLNNIRQLLNSLDFLVNVVLDMGKKKDR